MTATLPERIETIRRVARGKTLTLEKHSKTHPETWADDMNHQIRTLDWAARYIETKEGLNA